MSGHVRGVSTEEVAVRWSVIFIHVRKYKKDDQSVQATFFTKHVEQFLQSNAFLLVKIEPLNTMATKYE